MTLLGRRALACGWGPCGAIELSCRDASPGRGHAACAPGYTTPRRPPGSPETARSPSHLEMRARPDPVLLSNIPEHLR